MPFLTGPPKRWSFRKGFRFTHGQTIAPFTIVYETFGELNADRSNAILVCHALSASAHAAGKYTRRPGREAGLVGRAGRLWQGASISRSTSWSA